MYRVDRVFIGAYWINFRIKNVFDPKKLIFENVQSVSNKCNPKCSMFQVYFRRKQV